VLLSISSSGHGRTEFRDKKLRLLTYVLWSSDELSSCFRRRARRCLYLGDLVCASVPWVFSSIPPKIFLDLDLILLSTRQCGFSWNLGCTWSSSSITYFARVFVIAGVYFPLRLYAVGEVDFPRCFARDFYFDCGGYRRLWLIFRVIFTRFPFSSLKNSWLHASSALIRSLGFIPRHAFKNAIPADSSLDPYLYSKLLNRLCSEGCFPINDG
jgi:hypothetical protein